MVVVTLRLCLLTGTKFSVFACFSVHLVCTNFSDFVEQGKRTRATMVRNYWCNLILAKNRNSLK